jgi:predicted DNA-binding transcriptional regulator AlpA
MTKHDITSTHTLAEDLGVHISTIRLWIKSGKLPRPNKIGGLLFWQTADIAQWLLATGKTTTK